MARLIDTIAQQPENQGCAFIYMRRKGDMQNGIVDMTKHVVVGEPIRRGGKKPDGDAASSVAPDGAATANGDDRDDTDDDDEDDDDEDDDDDDMDDDDEDGTGDDRDEDVDDVANVPK